ncbi:hypothetical protein GCM10011316_07280 [Roseibium aquae]|uniref:Uncharacterized protein n=2 Tax=Roseibium aquae TaxID=1323746 RepID=A0A916TAA1_9HYPH|nr:hypothetical protein GCM10011316_07280 [Roseibium aquae]
MFPCEPVLSPMSPADTPSRSRANREVAATLSTYQPLVVEKRDADDTPEYFYVETECVREEVINELTQVQYRNRMQRLFGGTTHRFAFAVKLSADLNDRNYKPDDNEIFDPVSGALRGYHLIASRDSVESSGDGFAQITQILNAQPIRCDVKNTTLIFHRSDDVTYTFAGATLETAVDAEFVKILLETMSAGVSAFQDTTPQIYSQLPGLSVGLFRALNKAVLAYEGRTRPEPVGRAFSVSTKAKSYTIAHVSEFGLQANVHGLNSLYGLNAGRFQDAGLLNNIKNYMYIDVAAALDTHILNAQGNLSDFNEPDTFTIVERECKEARNFVESSFTKLSISDRWIALMEYTREKGLSDPGLRRQCVGAQNYARIDNEQFRSGFQAALEDSGFADSGDVSSDEESTETEEEVEVGAEDERWLTNSRAMLNYFEDRLLGSFIRLSSGIDDSALSETRLKSFASDYAEQLKVRDLSGRFLDNTRSWQKKSAIEFLDLFATSEFEIVRMACISSRRSADIGLQWELLAFGRDGTPVNMQMSFATGPSDQPVISAIAFFKATENVLARLAAVHGDGRCSGSRLNLEGVRDGVAAVGSDSARRG